MEVVLKKAKITKSIFKQIVRPSVNKMITYDVLGWVVDKYKYILFYEPNENKLAKFYYFIDVELFEEKKKISGEYKTIYSARIIMPNRLQNLYVNDSEDRSEVEKLIEELKNIKEEANKSGQIFI